MWICSLWLTFVKLMSNFICLDGSLRFGPHSVTFCNDLLHCDCLSKAYLGAGVLTVTQDILSHALAARRLGEGAVPRCDRSGLRRKNRHHQPGSTSTMPISRAPSSPLDERCAGCKINTAGGQNLPTMGSLPALRPRLCFFHSLYRHGTQNRIPWSLRSAAESHGEVLRLGMVEDDGGGRLLGV